jgi:hypothetical protein
MIALLAGLVTACYAEDPASDLPEHCPSNTDFTVTPHPVRSTIKLNENLRNDWEPSDSKLLSNISTFPADTKLTRIALGTKIECKYLFSNLYLTQTLTLHSKRNINPKNSLSDCTTTAGDPGSCPWKYD